MRYGRVGEGTMVGVQVDGSTGTCIVHWVRTGRGLFAKYLSHANTHAHSFPPKHYDKADKRCNELSDSMTIIKNGLRTNQYHHASTDGTDNTTFPISPEALRERNFQVRDKWVRL